MGAEPNLAEISNCSLEAKRFLDVYEDVFVMHRPKRFIFATLQASNFLSDSLCSNCNRLAKDCESISNEPVSSESS
jgi:hypothetical protein